MGASCSVIHVVPCRYRFFPVAEPHQDTTDIAACSSYNLVKSYLTHPRRRDSCNLRDDLRDVLFSPCCHSRNFYNCYLLLTCIFVPIPADIKAGGIHYSGCYYNCCYHIVNIFARVRGLNPPHGLQPFTLHFIYKSSNRLTVPVLRDTRRIMSRLIPSAPRMAVL